MTSWIVRMTWILEVVPPDAMCKANFPILKYVHNKIGKLLKHEMHSQEFKFDISKDTDDFKICI